MEANARPSTSFCHFCVLLRKQPGAAQFKMKRQTTWRHATDNPNRKGGHTTNSTDRKGGHRKGGQSTTMSATWKREST